MPNVYNMFQSIDCPCKGIWRWKVCLGWGVELHQSKTFIFKILFTHKPKLDAPCKAFLITSDEGIGK